ncbi:UDP-glucose 4-epimerase GalE [Roseibium sp. MMSF_3544]|uniref:UDP-glucose 4-epimerase GalE n=1 Tax=unclassified Roseibium TaxID=2629323 RepID=UPI00273D4271|nr:UDP-glucose 4-epimerase GalE [Roseibium sp. MMSF_3544]
MNKHKILVTGGAGFIGSHTCKQLASEGIEPVTYDNLSTGNLEAVRWGPFLRGDIRDTAHLRETLAAFGVETVIHFAASAYVGESVKDPAAYYDNNVRGTLSVLEACRAAGVDQLIFSSSCATYGIPPKLPISEDSVQDPINPYGKTKLMAEHIIKDYANAYGLKYVILRYFNASGADPDGELGEWHDPETHLIPRAMMAAAGRLPHLDVFGATYDTSDGTCLRDYVHVRDLADAHVLAWRHLDNGGESSAYNIGSGQCHSVREIVDSVERVTAQPVPMQVREKRAGDPPVLYANPQKASDEIGFKARYSDIDTIVRTAAPFFGLEAR